jgi:ABC-type antimicrobial peptide transport system permease subunit
MGVRNFVPRDVAFAVRSSLAGTDGLLQQLQRAVWSVDSNLPLARVETLENIYRRSIARTSFALVTLGIAGAMAVLLGVVGLYGVLSFAVTRRRRELGIRLALGAEQRTLKLSFVRQGLWLALIGIAVGTTASFGLARFLSSLLFGVRPVDPITYLCVPAALALVAAVASYLPARRAAAVDPVEVLRAE